MISLRPLLRKELGEEVFSPRGALLYLTCSVILSAFAISLVSNTELSLLDNAQAVYLMCGIALALGLLIVIIRGSDSFAGERERQTLELLLITPVSTRRIVRAKLCGMSAAWLLTFVVVCPYVWAVGSTGQNLVAALIYLFFSGTLLTLIFGGITLLLSSRSRSFRTPLAAGLALFLLAASPVVLGPSLRQSGVSRLVDWINPFAQALNMLDSVVVDSQGLLLQLPHLVILVCFAAAVMACVVFVTRRVEL